MKIIIGLFLSAMVLFAQKPMESLDKTLFVFVHGTMDKWSGTAHMGCNRDLEQLNGANYTTLGIGI
jgi:hypothetical protein